MSRSRPEGRRYRAALLEAWRTQIWPIPAVGIAAAVTVGTLLPRLDARLQAALPTELLTYFFDGGRGAARTVLSAVASSMVTVTSLTFSLTIVTLQLASTQYSPRVLRTFSRDRFVHVTLALLLATFTYALTVLRSIGDELSDRDDFVPRLSVTLAYVLALASVVALALFLAHLAQKIRVATMLRDVHSDADRTMHRVLGDRGVSRHPAGAPPEIPPDAPGGQEELLCATSSGILLAVDEEALVAAAKDARAAVWLDALPGGSVVAGTPIARARPIEGAGLGERAREELERRVGTAVSTGYERTDAQDVAFGLRQMVDVALKALSPGVNDPTTAVEALGHVATFLCELAGRDLGPRVLPDDSDRPWVVLARPGLPDLLELAVSQPCRYGADAPEVLERLLELLRQVAWTLRADGPTPSAPDETSAVVWQLARVRQAVRQGRGMPRERQDLEALADRVEEALQGRWPAAPVASP